MNDSNPPIASSGSDNADTVSSTNTPRRGRSSTPVPVENASSATHTEMENGQDLPNGMINDELMLATGTTDAEIGDHPSKKRKFDNNDSASSLARKPDAVEVPVAAAAAAADGEGRHTDTGSGTASPPAMTAAEAAAAAAAASARWEAALEREDLREITLLANKAIIEREVQIQAFAKSVTGQIVMRRWIGQNKIYYSTPSYCPNLQLKVGGDLHLRGLDGVVLVYNGTSEKMWISKSALSPMVACLKKFKHNSAQDQHVEDLKIETLNKSKFRVSGQYGKSFDMEFAQLQNLINSLSEANIFVTSFEKYLSHRDLVVKQYLVKLIEDDSFNTANRRLNVLKFLSLYNAYMKKNNCDCPWVYLGQNVINNMMKCFTC